MNNTVHSATGRTPFEMEHGVKQMTTLDMAVTGQPASMVEHNASRAVSGDFGDRMKASWALAADRVRRAQADMEERAARYQDDVSFKVGEKAYMSTEHLELPAWSIQKVRKMRNRYFGPWKIKKVWSPQAVELDIPRRLLPRLHRVVHPKYLKHWTPGGEDSVRVPDIDMAMSADPIMVEEVLGQRSYYSKRQYLVRWAGWSVTEATWEDEDDLFENPKLAAYLNKTAREFTGEETPVGAVMGEQEGCQEAKVGSEWTSSFADKKTEEGSFAAYGGACELLRRRNAVRRLKPGMLAEYGKHVDRVRRGGTYEKLRAVVPFLSCV